jgi:hypothetical protein
MFNVEKFGKVVGILLAATIVITILVAMTADREFGGYYLRDNSIYADFTWLEDIKVCIYSEERWKEIVDNDLHLKIKKD